MANLSIKDWLLLIEYRQSVSKAAASQGVSKQALAKKFGRLKEDDPAKVKYLILIENNKGGREKIYPDLKTRNRIKMRRYRAKKKVS